MYNVRLRNVKEKIIDVVNPISQGTPGASVSLYVLIPAQLRGELGINAATKLVILLASNGDVIYRKQEA
jgi:hypothetical protein